MMDFKDVRQTLSYIDKTYIDAPTLENGHTLDGMWQHIRELIGIAKGLIVAVEAAVEARHVVTIINEKQKD